MRQTDKHTNHKKTKHFQAGETIVQ